MDWLQLNLDSYRIVAELLKDLRVALREDLEQIHGTQWFRSGLSEDVFNRLIDRKESENAIDWHDREYQELIDFMGFSDLAEILDQNPNCLTVLNTIAPSRSLLQARLLELEVIRRRLGMTRPISESQLSFLANFHVRLHRAMSAESSTPSVDEEDLIPVELDETPPVDDTTPTSQEAAEDSPDDEPLSGTEVHAPSNVTPIRSASSPEEEHAVGDVPEPEVEPESKKPQASRHDRLMVSLANGDRQSVFRELYTEVTELAEGLWSPDGNSATPIWDTVRESTWYESNFSNLGLQPLSDFYEIVAGLARGREDGKPKDELQDFLKDRNFAQVLLSLRDMFQKHRI